MTGKKFKSFTLDFIYVEIFTSPTTKVITIFIKILIVFVVFDPCNLKK